MSPDSPSLPVGSRREFLVALGALVATLLPWRAVRAAAGPVHPEPRPGITGAKVLAADKLEGFDELIPIFDGIRQFPHIADGIGCYCGCADQPGYRSLLSCYEDGTAMAVHCEICQGEGRLVARRAREGQSLDQIRRAVDARYGPGAPPARASAARGPAATGLDHSCVSAR